MKVRTESQGLTLVSRIGVLASLVLATGMAQAAVPKTSADGDLKSVSAAESKPKGHSNSVSLDSTKSALGMALGNRLQTLRSQGPDGYRNLVAIMFDTKASMETRWKAVTAIGRIGGELSRPELEKAIDRPEWFMRNAALVAFSKIDRGHAVKWARQLLSDKALVVRVAAVDTLAQAGDKESAELLWEKLYSKENFKGSQSLFIRRHIVETLAKIQPMGQEGKFIEVLADQDESLHPAAIHALERMTNQVLGKPKEPLKDKRAHWQRWWKEHNQASL